jgi:hypothetical protein
MVGWSLSCANAIRGARLEVPGNRQALHHFVCGQIGRE